MVRLEELESPLSWFVAKCIIHCAIGVYGTPTQNRTGIEDLEGLCTIRYTIGVWREAQSTILIPLRVRTA